MGGRFSGARNEEDEEDDEDEGEEEVTQQKPKPSVAAPPPKSFAEMTAETAARKKKPPAAMEMSAAAQFAKLAAAKKAAAQAPKKAARVVQPEAPGPETAGDDLPRGGEGAVWEALEDSAVRETREVKSAKQGVVQEGESCTQTGPWRAEPTGRVRMPVRAPRGSEGWVTLDARRCKASDGSLGVQSFRLVSEAPDEEDEAEAQKQARIAYCLSLQEEAQKPASKPRAPAANEINEMLEMFGGEESDSEDYAPGYNTADAGSYEEDEANTNELPSASFGASAAESKPRTTKAAWRRTQAAAKNASVQDAAAEDAPVAPAELTAAQKRLRTARKKLREVETLEAAAEPLTDAQRERVARKADIQLEEEAAAAEVAAEQGTSASNKKAKKPRRPAGKKLGKQGAGSASSAVAGRTWFLLFALLPACALIASRVAGLI